MKVLKQSLFQSAALSLFTSFLLQVAPAQEIQAEEPPAPAVVDTNNLAGHYEMKLQIGSKTFVDLMDLRSKAGPISPFFFHGAIEGSITVVDVFTSPLTGTGHCNPWNGTCAFNFQIIAHEQGKDFVVNYSMGLSVFEVEPTTPGTVTLKGEARLENGELLGTFVATKLHD